MAGVDQRGGKREQWMDQALERRATTQNAHGPLLTFLYNQNIVRL
jgi:hypothetical protein